MRQNICFLSLLCLDPLDEVTKRDSSSPLKAEKGSDKTPSALEGCRCVLGVGAAWWG